MGRLFWKLFFSFWLALLTVAIGVGGIMQLFRPENSDQDFKDGGPGSLIMKSAIVAVNYGGAEAVRELLLTIELDELPTLLYAINEQGADLLGRPVLANDVSNAYQLAASGSSKLSAEYVQFEDGTSLLMFLPDFSNTQFQNLERNFPSRRSPPWWGTWLLSFIGLLASILFSAMLAWYLAAPVRHLRRAFRAAERGDLGIRVQPLIGDRRDEIADLGYAYDTMASKLKDLIAVQKHLFHDVSHELRSPLARLHAATGLIKQNPEKMNVVIDRIELEVERLDTLVGEILVLARLESGVVEERKEEVDLTLLVEDIISDARFEAQAKSCQVEFSGIPSRIVVNASAELLARAIDNVIRNAIKYTPMSSTISVQVKFNSELKQLQMDVIDLGEGVPEKDLASIFEPFYRSKGDDKKQGYGLGLAIARRAIEAHNGTINARNIPDAGLCISIHIPANLEQ